MANKKTMHLKMSKISKSERVSLHITFPVTRRIYLEVLKIW